MANGCILARQMFAMYVALANDGDHVLLSSFWCCHWEVWEVVEKMPQRETECDTLGEQTPQV